MYIQPVREQWDARLTKLQKTWKISKKINKTHIPILDEIRTELPPWGAHTLHSDDVLELDKREDVIDNLRRDVHAFSLLE